MSAIFNRCFYSKFRFKHFLYKAGDTYSTIKFVPFYESFLKNGNNVAVIDNYGSFKYKDVLLSSYFLAQKIKHLFPKSREKSERISFLCSNDATYVSVLLACWITGNVAVPLCTKHPEAMLEYYVEDSQSKLLITNELFAEPIKNISIKLKIPYFLVDHNMLKIPSPPNQQELHQSEFFSWGEDFKTKRGLIIYTSGTTGKPKGVVLNHDTLYAQTSAAIQAWEISSSDSILNSLPLHHIHGIMLALLCPLKVGATVVMQQKFDAVEAWKHFLNLTNKPKVNLFFAVPTMYSKLVEEFENVGEKESFSKKCCLENMRLFCSGSASLPIPVFQGMEKITGHKLIERFGMSEIGMALSTTLNGPRTPGTVGVPIPDVEVKLRKSDGSTDIVIGDYNSVRVLPENGDTEGELLVRGPGVFKEYWNKEKASKEAFTEDGWFLTGDTACYTEGAFKILGRTSVDIIKSGGYKISALDVESCLLRHPDISECTVFGLDDDVWGERVASLILFKEGKSISDADLKAWCKQYIPPYCVPTVITPVDVIPRNVLGKVNKKELKKTYSLK